VGDEDARAADFEGVVDFGGLVAVVQGRGDEAGAVAGEVVDEECAAVGEERGDAVAGLEAKGEVVGGEAAGGGVELAPGPAAFVRDEGEIVGFGGEAEGEDFGEGDGVGEGRAGDGHGEAWSGVGE
jgi:hypothetical protein